MTVFIVVAGARITILVDRAGGGAAAELSTAIGRAVCVDAAREIFRNALAQVAIAIVRESAIILACTGRVAGAEFRVAREHTAVPARVRHARSAVAAVAVGAVRFVPAICRARVAAAGVAATLAVGAAQLFLATT